MGGDYAPEVVIKGAKSALESYSDIKKLYLVGREGEVKPLLDKYKLPSARIEFIHTDEVVEMHESGAKMLRKKKNASISIATNLVKTGDADGVVGAGNTGAAVANATIKLRLLPGVERAGIASPMPNEYGLCNLLDAGANPEAKPSHLLGYSIMGAIYSKYVQGVNLPKVGLMSNGEEEEKGTDFTRETHSLIKDFVASKKAPFEYLGYIEGRDLFLEDVQVCLTDGFTGNVMLKTAEGVAKGMSGWMKAEFKRNPLRMLGALMSKGVFSAVKERTSHERAGGSPLLGVNGVCIIAHGSSSDYAIENALRVARETISKAVNPQIEEAFSSLQSLD